MKYLKRIFERLDLNDSTKKVLSDFGLSEDEYEEMMEFIGKLGYTDVKNELPFLSKWDDFNVGYDQMRMIVNFYEKKKGVSDKSKEVEDFFLDLIEIDNDVVPSFNYSDKTVRFTIRSKQSLMDISNIIADIDKRFNRSNVDYEVIDIYKNQQGYFNIDCKFENKK